MNNLSLYRTLYFALGFFVPFATLGPPLPGMIWITPSYFIGAALVALSLLSGKTNARQVTFTLLIIVFAATSMGRHDLNTYLISLAAFALATCPLFITFSNMDRFNSLVSGFIISYIITISLIIAEILSQLLGIFYIYDQLSPFRPIKIHPHNYFVAYYRPQAAFAEPAHLGYYLAFTYVVFDRLKMRQRNLLQISCLAATFFTGSLVGIILIATYIGVSAVSRFLALYSNGHSTVGRPFLVSMLIIFPASILTLAQFGADFLNTISSRISRTQEALSAGQMTGSEGSRANALRTLLDYWDDKGVAGMLIGEGYGNISSWLTETYGHLQWSTMAGGSVDSKFVAIVLGTGVIGALFYIGFFAIVFKYFKAATDMPIIALFIMANLASGGLLWYWKWHLLFILLIVIRYHKSANTEQYENIEHHTIAREARV